MAKYLLVYGGASVFSLASFIEGAGGASLVPIGVVMVVHGALALIFRD